MTKKGQAVQQASENLKQAQSNLSRFVEQNGFAWENGSWQASTYKVLTDDISKATKELEGVQNEYNDALNGTSDELEDVNLDLDELNENLDATTSTTGGASNAIKDFASSLQSTLESQMNIFDKFEAKAAMSKQELLNNMRSQIEGMTNWAGQMDKLSTLGIDKGLYKKLAEMGPQGAQYVGAFASMTAEEMAQANELWAQSLTLPGDLAGQITRDWAGISTDMVGGLSAGWTDSEGQFHEAVLLTSRSAQEEMKSDNGIHSPSTVYYEFGSNMMLGLRFGIWDSRSLLLTTLETVCNLLIKRADGLLNKETLVEHGKNLIAGLTEGLQDSSLISALESAADKVAEIPDRVTRKRNLIESPSKLFMQHGRNIDRGLAIGLTKNAGIVVTAMDDVNNQVIDSMRYTVATIATTIQDGIEDPVITPVLDLSRVNSGIRTLNNAFSTQQALNAAGSMSTLQNGQSSGGVNFIQNNYSPKPLSRTEIYRQTNNQLTMLRRVAVN